MTVQTYRERLTAPPSWWLSAAAFAVVWGWILLVATTWPIAIGTAAGVGALTFWAVWRYGALDIVVDPARLRVGPATLEPGHVGEVEVLHRADYRNRLGVGADARAHLATRPYLDRGVLVRVEDETDPTPYWLLSSRDPEALAKALGHTGHTAGTTQGEEVARVQEDQED